MRRTTVVHSDEHQKARPRFRIRSLLVLMVVCGILLGWWSSLRMADNRHRDLNDQLFEALRELAYAEQELERSREELQDRERPVQRKSRVLYHCNLDGESLRGITISSLDQEHGNICQGALFRDSYLQGAKLEGGFRRQDSIDRGSSTRSSLAE